MHFDIITIFPEMFAPLQYGIVGRAIGQKIITVNYINPRTYSKRPYGNVDDRPYGGGPGMVMMVDPLRQAINAAKKNAPNKALSHVCHFSPQGKLLKQNNVEQLATQQHLILLTSRYEGIDERLIELEIDSEWSIGDYVISGGELAAMVLIDATTRLLQGALGNSESAQQDSFTSGLLDYPHYTRPEVFDDKKVPEILLSGNHKEITRWRLKQSLGRTWLRRPDLIQKLKLTDNEILLLNEFLKESKGN